MSDLWLFALGSVVFIMTTWASMAYLLARFDEVYRRDLDASPAIAQVRSEGEFTERYVPAESPD